MSGQVQPPCYLAEYISKHFEIPIELVRYEWEITGGYIVSLTDEQVAQSVEEIWQLLLQKNPALSITSWIRLAGFKYVEDLKHKR